MDRWPLHCVGKRPYTVWPTNFSYQFDVLGCRCSWSKIQAEALPVLVHDTRPDVSSSCIWLGWKTLFTTEMRKETSAAILQVSDLFSVECGSIICSQGVISESNFKDLCTLNELTGPSPQGLDWLLQWFKKRRCRRPVGSSPLPPLPWDTLQPAISPIKWTWELRARTMKFICKILNRLKNLPCRHCLPTNRTYRTMSVKIS